MRTIFSILCLVLLFPSLAASQQNPSTSDGFETFLNEFRAAVVHNDKDKVAAMSSFPKFNWEEGLGDDVSRDVFLQKFSKLLTPDVRKQIASGKYVKTQEGNYVIDWVKGGNQYSLWFDRQPGGGFKFAGLLVGPA